MKHEFFGIHKLPRETIISSLVLWFSIAYFKSVLGFGGKQILTYRLKTKWDRTLVKYSIYFDQINNVTELVHTVARESV